MDQGTKEKVASTGLKLIVPVIIGGLAMIANPTLGCFIVGIGLAIVWSIVTWVGWFEFLVRKRAQYLGYAAIAVASVVLGLFMRGGKANVPKDANQAGVTPPSVTTAVQNTPASNVTSHGQSGGVTAQTYIDNRVAQYFISQPQDEKDKWRQYLMAKYPLGWAIFAADGKTIHIPNGPSYQRDLDVKWGAERVSRLTPDEVWLQFPDIYVKGFGTLTGGGVGVKRRAGNVLKSLFARTVVTTEVLTDEADFVVVALGFREADESDLRPPNPKSQRAPAKATP